MNCSLHHTCFPKYLEFLIFLLMRLFRKDFQRNLQDFFEIPDNNKEESEIACRA